MAINFTTLFTRLGKHFFRIKCADLFRGGQSHGTTVDLGTVSSGAIKDLLDLTNETRTQYNSGGQEELADTLYQQNTNETNSLTSIVTNAMGRASAICNETVKDDNPQPSNNIQVSLAEIIRQMTGAQTVDDNAIGISSTPDGGNTGNPNVVLTTKRPDGLTNEYIFAEDLILTCTADAQNNSAVLGRESWSWRGEPSESNSSYLWPGGSGATGSTRSVSALDNNANGQLLYNGGFDLFTVTDTPDKWQTITSGGTFGTNILAGGGVGYTGANYLRLYSDTGGVTAGIKQKFNDSTNGTGAVLTSRMRLALNFVTAVSAVPVAGVLEVALVDGSETIIQDDQSNNNSTTVDLTGETTSWALHTATFILPEVLPSEINLRIKLTTAIDDLKYAHIDHMGFAEHVPLYSNGPAFRIFSGPTASIIDDFHTITPTNDYSGDFQTFFWRVFNMPQYTDAKGAYQLPSTGAPSINDNLIG